MRRFKALALVMALVLQALWVTPGVAASPLVTVTFNGHPVLFDVDPIIVDGRTLVPFRAILEKIGATVGWDEDTRTVTAQRSDTTVKLVIDDATAYVNGNPVELDVAPTIRNSRTLIPLRFVSEQLGNVVTWDPDTRNANIVDLNYPARGGTVQLAMWSAPKGKFNPIIYDSLYDRFILDLVFDGLWYMDDSLRPQPSLARYWEISDDNLSFTFYLRQGVKFHDGAPLTAEDVRFTVEAIMHKDYKGPYNSGYDSLEGYEAFHAGGADHVSGIQVVDPYTIRFVLKKPDAPFFTNNTGTGILPKHLYQNVAIADWGTSKDPNNARPVGTGSFKFAESSEGQYYSLTANENYHLGRPYVDGVIWKVREQQVGLLELDRGDLDAADVQPADIQTAQGMNNIHLVEYPQLGYQYVGFNTTREPFDDKRVRQAAGWAIDRKALIEQLTQGHAGAIFSPIHPLTWAYTDEFGSFGYDQSAGERSAKAKALLEEAGWTTGANGVRTKGGKALDIELLYPKGNKVRERSAPIIASWLKEAGFNVTLTVMEFGALADRIYTARDFQTYLMGWGLAFDPDPRGIFSKDQIGPDKYNAYQWSTEKSEELLEKAVRTLDIDERSDYYRQWQEHFADEVPIIPLYAMNNIYGVNNRLQGFKPHPASDYSLWNVWEWWLGN